MNALDKICDIGIEAIKDNEGIYIKEKLIKEADHIVRNNMTEAELINAVIQVALELTTAEEPKWQYVSSKLFVHNLYSDVRKNRNLPKDQNLYENFYGFIQDLTSQGLYGEYILKNYTKEDILELEKELKPERDFIFTYSGIKLLKDRYLVQNYNREILELPQQMFMGIAMHLAIP